MGNLKKTIRYLKRNGIMNTCYAVQERLLLKRGVPYSYAPIDDAEYERQSRFCESLSDAPRFSILVPVFETPEKYLRAMIESCLNQSYGNFELLLADASKTDAPHAIIASYKDCRIKYFKLYENKSISENTNECLDKVLGDYCVLLDHDDLLTTDALYENAKAIVEARKAGIKLRMIYSDEDKTDSEGSGFFEPHHKEKLNLDLLLSNNYICHLSTIEKDLIRKLRFRHEFNGSQDYDLFLRCVGEILFEDGKLNLENEKQIYHIEKVLYHWRCHELSTAFDPAAKEYAYEAGERAIKDFVKNHFGEVPVHGIKHRGFYRVEWGNRLFELRPDIGAVGGMSISKNKIAHGILTEDGQEKYQGVNSHFSGPQNRMDLQQSVYALDIRTITVSPEFKQDYDFCMMKLGRKPDDSTVELASRELGEMLSKKGKRILFDPELNRDLGKA